ncbi:hypothetical protein [Soonwooa sp.]|uniref:hypothetical protein n=1 Tax=Soonwooa sp. TaxID=1938592 RepID=UPI0035B2C046
MDFINSTSTNLDLIDAISNSKFLNLSSQSLNKDIFRIGKKGVKVVLKKINGSSNYNKVDIAIKPHYYINNDIHNGDQLNIVNLESALREIAYKLNIEQYTKILKPTSADAGVNIIPDQFDSKDIVNQALYFNKKPLLQVHSHLPYFKSTKKKETYPTISAKIYHKGLQYPNIIHPNTLRFENMFCTAEKLQRDFRIHSYNDLLNPDIIRSLYNRLLKSWEHILILDQLQNDSGIHDIRYYENEFHYRNGLRNARINYYQQFGYWHTELKKQLTYEIEQCFLKMQIPALIDR